MKRFFVFIAFCCSLVMLKSQIPETYKGPEIKFDKIVHDFGEVKLGSKVSVEFVFTNIGKSPLIIEEVISSCECTLAEAPKTPIMPGKTEVIKVSYSAENLGLISKRITVISNALTDRITLQIKGKTVE